MEHISNDYEDHPNEQKNRHKLCNETGHHIAIFIDLSKAFDTLSHSQIINNLSNYGMCDVEKEYFINYLFDRKQLVNFQMCYQNLNCPTGVNFRFLAFYFEFQ